MYVHDSIHTRGKLKIPVLLKPGASLDGDAVPAPLPSSTSKPSKPAAEALDVNDFLKQFDAQFQSTKASSEANYR
jgi:hypothetical protein